MPRGLRRFHESGQSHFVTFSCYRRQPNFVNAAVYDLFPMCLEEMRRRFNMRVYGYVVMPEHVHLLLSEPDHGTLAEAMHYLKLSFAKRVRSAQVSVQKRDANALTISAQVLGHRHPIAFSRKRNRIRLPKSCRRPWNVLTIDGRCHPAASKKSDGGPGFPLTVLASRRHSASGRPPASL